MNSKGDLPLSIHVPSRRVILALSVAAGLSIFLLAVFLRVACDDWMHRNGSLHLAASLFVAVMVSVMLARRQLANRQKKLEMLRRLKTIRWMNDRIRNALQAIECVTFAASPEATEAVRNSVDTIEEVLQEVLADAHPHAAGSRLKKEDRREEVQVGPR